MSEFFEKHRKEYFEKLFDVSADGAWEPWVEFCLVGTIEQAGASLDRCRSLASLKREYEQHVGHLSSRMHAILNRLFANPMVEPNQLRKDLKISYHTAQKDMDKLVQAGILAPLSGVAVKTFVVERTFDIAYGD